MAKGKLSKTWAEQLADLEDPAPKGRNLFNADISLQGSDFVVDFDPEDQHQEVADDDTSGSASDEDPAEAREHYVDVGYAANQLYKYCITKNFQ